MIWFESNLAKKIQAVALLVHEEGGRIDRVRLLKLLYIADRESIAERGVPIVGGRYSALDNGPLHSEVYDLIKGGHEDLVHWQEFFSNAGHQVVAVRPSENLELSSFEVEKLIDVSERHSSLDTWALVELTHQFPEWQKFRQQGTSKPIPLDEIMLAVGLSREDIDHLVAEAKHHHRMRRVLHR